MAKTHIISGEDKNSAPFLRGILTRSLCKAGLPFDDAFTVATEIREELEDIKIVSAVNLRHMVVSTIRNQFSEEIIERYQAIEQVQHTIFVKELDGQLTPYSNQRLGQDLEVIGLSQRKVHTAVISINTQLMKSGIKEIHVNQLGYLVYRFLERQSLFGPKIAHKYINWINFIRIGIPLIILIGGAGGSGKSSLSSALANRLGIVRTQSTDMLREVMRMMIPKKLLPVLHKSSFNAGNALPAENFAATDDPDNMLIAGFRTQAELLSVPCEAVIKRSLKEQVSLLLEGVHVTSGLLPKIPQKKAMVIHVMLAILSQKVLKKRIKGRNRQVPQRRSETLSDSFDPIWRLQNYLLDEADRENTLIIENLDKEEAMHEIMKYIMKQISKRFKVSAKDVFGKEELLDHVSTNHPEYK